MGKSDYHIEANTLPDLFGGLFTLVLYLRETSDFGDPKILHDKIDALFKSIESKSKQLKIPDEDFLDAKYALSALIDETVLYSNWSLRNVWLDNPMVVEYFNDALAGEMFFDRIEKIRNDVSKQKVLEVYYLCLMFGFEGKFKIFGPEELQNYLIEIYKQLKFKKLDKLSPHAEPQKITIKKRSLIPKWLIYASYGIVLLAVVAIYIVLKVKMFGLANVISDGISRILF